MDFKWVPKGSGNVKISENKLYINTSSVAICSKVLGAEDFSLEFSVDTMFAMCGIAKTDVLTKIYSNYFNTQDVRCLYANNGNLYPGVKNVGMGVFSESQIVRFDYNATKKQIDVFLDGVYKCSPFSDLEKEPFVIIFTSGSSNGGYNASIFASLKRMILETKDGIYSFVDNELKMLGDATNNKGSMFSQGFTKLTKANCETIASQLGKCKILRAEI